MRKHKSGFINYRVIINIFGNDFERSEWSIWKTEKVREVEKLVYGNCPPDEDQ